MTKTYNAKITYKVKPTHPDIQDMPESLWKDKVFTYEDTYRIDPDCFYGNSHIADYITEDLMLIAGGGYSTDHIYDVDVTIELA